MLIQELQDTNDGGWPNPCQGLHFACIWPAIIVDERSTLTNVES